MEGERESFEVAMDLPPEELQTLTLKGLLQQSFSIPKKSPKTFCLVTLTLILPLSFASLGYTLFIHPLFSLIVHRRHHYPTSQWAKIFIFHFCYLIFHFAFSLLSIAAAVFTVASLYTAKPVSFSTTLSAIPRLLRRLLLIFPWAFLPMVLLYSIVFLLFLLLIAACKDTEDSILFDIDVILFFILFFAMHGCISAVWHLASVVSVLEPVYGRAAMKKSLELLKGKVLMAGTLVLAYYVICGFIYVMFESMVVHGEDEVVAVRILVFKGSFGKIVCGGVLVGVLVMVNFVGLLVQCVFYCMCKSYHHQGIDKSALCEQLGGYA